MTYLIDTDWVIDHLHQKESVTRRLEEFAPAGLALSIISLAELYEGVFYSRDPVESNAALQASRGDERVLGGGLEILEGLKRFALLLPAVVSAGLRRNSLKDRCQQP